MQRDFKDQWTKVKHAKHDPKQELPVTVGLTRRQWILVELIATGLKNKDMADVLGTTEHVIKNYLRAVYDELGMWNRVEVALWFEVHKGEKPEWIPTN